MESEKLSHLPEVTQLEEVGLRFEPRSVPLFWLN